MDNTTLPSTPASAPNVVERVQSRIGDLYPQYRDWTVTTITCDLYYLHASPQELVEAVRGNSGGRDPVSIVEEHISEMAVPSGTVAVIVQNPGNGRKAVVLVDDILLQVPTNDGPRLSMYDLEAAMVGKPYFMVLPGSTTTLCVITLVGGTVVYGASACIARENFDWEMGKSIALKRAQDAAFQALAAITSKEIATAHAIVEAAQRA